MKKTTKLLLVASSFLLLLVILAYLVGGNTYKMHSANQLFASPELENQGKALSIYQDLAIDLPASPYVRHNLGLAEQTAGHLNEAIGEYQKGVAELEKGNLKAQAELSFKYHYHMGSTLFNLGETSPPEEAVNYYQQALSHFTEAVRDDPTDLDAKYNYELTKLRLEATSQQPQDQNQERTDCALGDEQMPDQSPAAEQTSEEGANEQQPEQIEEQKQQPSPEPQEGMSKEEAEALLEMAENDEAYQAPIIISTPTPPGKDW